MGCLQPVDVAIPRILLLYKLKTVKSRYVNLNDFCMETSPQKASGPGQREWFLPCSLWLFRNTYSSLNRAQSESVVLQGKYPVHNFCDFLYSAARLLGKDHMICESAFKIYSKKTRDGIRNKKMQHGQWAERRTAVRNSEGEHIQICGRSHLHTQKESHFRVLKNYKSFKMSSPGSPSNFNLS